MVVRFSYFGYTVTFATQSESTADRREEANIRVIAKYGVKPALDYVEPGLPFPDYVPCLIWDSVSETYC